MDTGDVTPTRRFAILVALVGCLGLGIAWFGVPDPATIADTVRNAQTPLPVPLLAVVVCAVLVVSLVPRTWLAAAAGLLFGPLTGALYVMTGALIGALTAFAVGRWLGRDFVAVQRRLRRLDGWLTRSGVLGVMVVRMLPLAPFGMVSYAFGTSGVRPVAFAIGTVLGMVPSTLVYVHVGAHATQPGSLGFWVSISAAVALWLTTASVTAWLRRRQRRRGVASEEPSGESSQIARVPSES